MEEVMFTKADLEEIQVAISYMRDMFYSDDSILRSIQPIQECMIDNRRHLDDIEVKILKVIGNMKAIK